MLADSFGRIATDLRVSVTDRCNLRCSYCMPAEGLDWLPGPALLTDGEVSRLIAVAVQRLGVTEVRFTGGEPLLRRGLPGLVAATAALDPRPEISLTTNGIGLARLAGPLAAAGLDRLNVSLDTLSRADLQRAGPPRPAARRAGRPGRRGRRRAGPGEGERGADARRQRPRGAPACSGSAWTAATSSASSSRCPWTPSTAGGAPTWSPPTRSSPASPTGSRLTPDDPGSRGSAPAETFLVDGGPGRVGVIGSVTRPFCGTCDRVRLTADGQVRNCLFATTETDLRTLLRSGATDDQLAAAWRGAVAAKLPGHGINDPGFLQPARPMSAIGG